MVDELFPHHTPKLSQKELAVKLSCIPDILQRIIEKKDYSGSNLILSHFKKKPEVIIDTKYKQFSEDRTYDRVSRGDVYQIYAYGAKTGAKKLCFSILIMGKPHS